MSTAKTIAISETRHGVPAVYAIERRPAPLNSHEAPKHVADQISALLRSQLADLTSEPAHAAKFAPAQALDARVAQLKRSQVLTAPMIPMNFPVPLGTRIIAPPYDHSWTVGAAGPLPRFDGDMFVFGEDGFSAYGVSIMLSSPTPVLVSVIPQGTYNFSWGSFENLPDLRSRGGLGILVYRNGNPDPLVSRQAVLWTVSGVSQFTGNTGSGQYADAVAVMTDFGPIRLAPVLFDMNPGDTFEVWMWCWTVGQNESGHAFINALQCRIPAILIDAGPQIIIH